MAELAAKEKAEKAEREAKEKREAEEKKRREEEEKKAEEERIAAQKKKEEEAAQQAAAAAAAAQTQQNQFTAAQNAFNMQNPYAAGMMAPGTAGILPQMIGIPQMTTSGDATKPVEGVNQTQLMIDQQQMIYQQMALHQQMFQQYQAMLAQQLAMQQHMMSQGATNTNTTTSAAPNGTNASNVTANNMMQQNPYAAAMAGGMGNFPMMPQMGGATMPVPGATSDGQTTQQQFVPMTGFMPAMPFIYPNSP